LATGFGLAGDHRLVDLRGAVDDLAVGGHAAARADQHHVTDGCSSVDSDGLGARRR
jgi:hypothetical protein